jgi:serine/threonine protein kinase
MSLSKLKFKHVNILKDEVLGAGAYGTVYKAKCDDLLCAAKCLHQAILYQSGLQAEYSSSPVSRFEREINLLSSFHHPNIVQYLGVYEDSDTKQPVLLMELMDRSLTKYLAECPSQLVPYHLQVNICHDIALALSFLHHNDIFHRDMSSNNVLMLGDRAKITDFGMANTTKAINSQMTKCPGTDVYMPPEAVIGNPHYTASKIDTFSFGILVIQILIKEFPNPSERQKLADDNEENFLSVYIRVPELERRKKHIDLIHPKHALLPISLDCLNDVGLNRPTAQQLCERMAIVKESPEYAKSKDILVTAQQSGDTQADISQIPAKQLENFIFQEQELKNLHSLLDDERKKNSSAISEAKSQIYQLETTNAEQEYEIEHLKKCLGGAVSDKKSLQEKLEALQLNTDAQNPQQSIRLVRARSFGSKSCELNWMEGTKAPAECQISKGYAVVNGDIVYVSSFSNKIGAYNSNNDSWSMLPECPTNEFAMVDINGGLTIVGGCSIQGSYSSSLYTYYEDDTDKQRWNDDYPPMLTKRKAVAAICTQSVLIVAGGEGEGGYALTKVEILDIKTRTWSSTVSIPSGRKNAALVTCGHCLYLVGGKSNKECTTTVYACSLGIILSMRQPDTLFKQVAGTIDPLRYWAKIIDVPLTQTASISFDSQLYAIGGRNADGQAVRSVYAYDLSTNTWQLISRMVTKRYSCVAAVLQNDRLMVFGGLDGDVHLDTIEIASSFF